MAVKPTRVQSKNVFAYIGQTPTRRVQTLDYASNFTTDSVFELGNAGIVEDSVSLVETGVTLVSNEWGTTDLEAMLFGIFEQRNVLGKLASPAVQSSTTSVVKVAARGAGGRWNAVATNDWIQVIRFNHYATTNAVEYTQVTARRYVPGSLIDRLTVSPVLSGIPATGDIVTLVNDYTITQDTVDANPVHIVVPHRYSTTSTFIMHSVALPRCAVESLTYRIDTGGAAEQNYSLVGEEERLLLGSRRELLTVVASYMSYANSTVVARVPKGSLSAVGSPYVFYAASNLATAKRISHTSAQVTVQARVGSGLSLDSTTQLIYYFTNKTKKGWKGLTNITSGIGKLTKGYVEIYMTVGATTDKMLRCTGIDINIPLTRESIDELGETRSIDKPLEGNLRNEITLTFNRNDLREYAKMVRHPVTFDAGTLKEILMADLKSVKNVEIVVKCYRSQTSKSATTLLKTFTFSDCNFIGDNATTPISGASGLELRFSSQSINIAGSGLPPTYV